MKRDTKIEVGDKVRGVGFFTTISGTVYDVFEKDGQRWAQIEWKTKGNQFSKPRTSCAAHPCSALVLQMKGKVAAA